MQKKMGAKRSGSLSRLKLSAKHEHEVLMEKEAYFGVALIIGFVFIAMLVSAQAANPLSDLGNTLVKAAEFVLGPSPSESTVVDPELAFWGLPEGFATVSFLSARLLFFIILFVVVWSALHRISMFNTNPFIVFVLAGAVSILSTRFLMQPEWIKAILLPYTTLGIAVTSFIPLLIYAYFVEGLDSKSLRKVAWVFAAVIFIMFFISRYTELGNEAVYVYPVISVVCILMFFFDGSIQRIRRRMESEKAMTPVKYIQYQRLQEQNEGLFKAQQTFKVGSRDYNAIERQINENMKKLSRMMK